MSLMKLYIAMTLDGYIAKPDGNLDWLTSIPYPEDGSDYGYQELLDSLEVAVMGRSTYEEVLKLSPEWPYANLKSYVVTKRLYSIPKDVVRFFQRSAIRAGLPANAKCKSRLCRGKQTG